MIGRRLGVVAVVSMVLALEVIAPVSAARPGIEITCGHLQTIVMGTTGGTACTHGPDPHPLESSTPTYAGEIAAASASVPCYGDGTSGKRVQAMYVRPADRPDRSAEVLPHIRQWAAEVDAVFSASAAASGGVRHVRFVTAPDCSLNVASATVTARGDDTFANTISELAAQGYNRSDRKYLVWMDSSVLCGIATYYIDDRSTADNANNGDPDLPGSVARIDNGCWGLASRGQSVEAHELLHVLGGVQPTAPHATKLGHCYDESDRMCYDDGSPGFVAASACATDQEATFDCGHDDYFNTSPPARTYLAEHWNTASSEFLETTLPPPPPSGSVTRLAGSDRIETARAASKNAFGPTSAAAAVLANAASFADALAGVPLAARRGGPLLLTPIDRLDGRVADELRRVLSRDATVYLLGGTGALTDSVAEGVQRLGFSVERLGGSNRFETAAIIAEDGLDSPNVIFEVTGLTFVDALAAGAAAAEVGGAILLTNGETQSVESARYLATHPASTRYALGGQAARADPAARPFAGRDRFETAVLVAREFFDKPTVMGIASGFVFPDALAGGANIASHSGPMLLATPSAPLPQTLVDYLRGVPSLDHALLYGGTTVLSNQVADSVARLTG